MAKLETAVPLEQRDAPIERRVARGLVVLFLRQGLAYGATFFGNVLLSRWLNYETYGIFAAALAFQATLVVLADLGLGAALIQHAKEPDQADLAELFTVQLVLFGLVSLAVWLLAPWIGAAVNLGPSGATLIRSLALVLFATAFRSIPAVMLERDLRFGSIAFAEVVSTIAYQLTVVALVWLGWGVMSIVVGLAVRYSIDLLLILAAYPWRPRITRRVSRVWPFLRFGIGMQTVRLLAYMKDYIPVLVLVPLLGAASAGQWSWALTFVAIPVYLTRLVDRVVFPGYARVQHDPAAIGSLAEMALWLNFSTGLPMLLMLLIFAPWIVPAVFGAQWLVALPIANLLAVNMVGGFVTGSILPILYATGRSRKAAQFCAVWVALTAIGAAGGLFANRLLGLAAAYSAATVIATFLLLYAVRPLADFGFVRSIRVPALASTLSAVLAFGLLAGSVAWPVALAAFAACYVLVLFGEARRRLQSMAPRIL